MIRVLDLLFRDEGRGRRRDDARDRGSRPGGRCFRGDRHHHGSLNEEDADEVSEDLPANSSVLLVAFENVWAGEGGLGAR